MVITKKSFEEPPVNNNPFFVDMATRYIKQYVEDPDYIDVMDFLADANQTLTNDELDELTETVVELLDRAEVSVTFKEKRAEEE